MSERISPDQIRALQHEDQDAWDQAYPHLFGIAMAYLRRWLSTTSNEELEDMAQDSLIQLYRGIQKHQPEGSALEGFLFRIIRHKRIDRFRRQKIRHIIPYDDEVDVYTQNDTPLVDEHIDKAALAKDIRKAFRYLSPEQRAVMRRLFFLEQSYDEAAEELKLNLNTVKSHRTRGLQALRERFKRE